MVINIYAIACFVSLVFVVMLAIIGRKRNITNFLLLFVAIMINQLGEYMISISDTMNMAIMGHRLVYLGGVFTPILMLFSIMKLSKIKVPNWLWGGLLILASVVFYFAFTVGTNAAFYSRLALVEENGMMVLLKDRGPMHSLWLVLLVGCVAIMIGILIYSVVKKTDVSYRTITFMVLTVVITMASYIVERILDTYIELVALAYLLDEIVFISLVRRIGRYEIMENVVASMSENTQKGYIVFEKTGAYIGSNDAAKMYFPNLHKQRIDAKLDENTAPVLYEKFGRRIGESKDVIYESILEKDDRFLKCSLKTVHRGRKKKIDGYVVEIVDDTQQQTYMRLLDKYNTNLENEVREKTEHISLMKDKIVLGMADMIENRDSNTGGHVKRTSDVVRIFTTELKKRGKEYGFSDEFLNYVAKAAPMHDLGKIAIDDRILRKPGKFTTEEFEEMKKHSEKGSEIVAQILEGVEDEKFVQIAKNVAHYHHEKWNGEGYPEKNAGINIPPEARIMALADVFDALVSKRCYKEKMDYDKAFQIIEESLGSHFDPEIGRMFINCRTKLEAYYNTVE